MSVLLPLKYSDHIHRISGQETTSQAIAFTAMELGRHPDVQRRLRQEIEAFPSQPTYDDFQTRLPYLDAVLKET
jgi:cytochrome P450